MEKVKEQGERMKATAEVFLKNNVRAYIRDMSDTIYFCDIILVGEDSLTIQCFGPEQRRGEKKVLYWPLILVFEEFKDRGDDK